MSTKADPGPFDCYANAADNEPMFILLGRDPLASVLVNLWADARELAGEHPVKVAEARQVAIQMCAWAYGLNKKPAAMAFKPEEGQVDAHLEAWRYSDGKPLSSHARALIREVMLTYTGHIV